MEITLLLTALGATGSSLLSWGSADLRYILMAAWRMLMGVGIGGIYPLSSALSFEDTVQSAGSGVGGSAGQSKPMKESAIQPAGNALIGAGSNDDEGQGNVEVNGKKITHSSDEMPSLTFEHFEEQRGRRKAVGWAAFWQQPGQMMPYVFGLVLLELFKFKDIEFQYRSILIFGALPPFGILLTWGLEDRHSMFHIFNLKRHFSVINQSAPSSSSSSSSSIPTGNDGPAAETKDHPVTMIQTYCSLLRNPRYGRWLAGTCLSWMMFDIYAYGITLYTPEIMESVFGTSDTMATDYWQNVLALFITIPASMLSVFALAGLAPSSSAISSSAISSWPGWLQRGVPADVCRPGDSYSPRQLFSLQGLRSNLNFGSTLIFCIFLLAKFFRSSVFQHHICDPKRALPPNIRASCNGLSAAVGKIGAFIGSFLFPYIYDDLGMAYIFFFSAVVGIFGFLFTICLIPAAAAPPIDPRRPAVASEIKSEDERNENTGQSHESETTPLRDRLGSRPFFFWWGFGSGALVLFVVQWAQSGLVIRDGHDARNPAATPAPPPVAIGLYQRQ